MNRESLALHVAATAVAAFVAVVAAGATWQLADRAVASTRVVRRATAGVLRQATTRRASAGTARLGYARALVAFLVAPGVIGVASASPVAFAVAAIGALWVHRTLPALRARRRDARAAAAIEADLPDVVDLIAVAAVAGSNVRLAVEAVVRHGRGPAVDALRSALGDVGAGERLADALAALPERYGEPVRPLVAVLVDSDRYGAPLAPALGALSGELRAARRRRAEEHVRRVPVRLLLPLVTCVLPAFALLTVAPLLASGIRTLADEPPSLPTASDQEGPP